MTPAESTMDVEAAVLTPTKYFGQPADVVRTPGLTRDEKRRILESWARDAEQLSEAEAENMPGGERPHLRQVRLALLDLEESSPGRATSGSSTGP